MRRGHGLHWSACSTSWPRNPTLAAAQARLLIDQLLAEPLLDSPTAEDLLENLIEGDSSYAAQIFNRDTPGLVMQLSPDDRFKICRAVRPHYQPV